MPNKEPYKMHPGMHSEVNPGNFKGSEVMKYGALKMHPMKYPQEFKDQKGTSDGITRADVIKARTEGYNPKMDHPQAHHPMGYVSDAQRKAVHASKADGGKGKPKMDHGPGMFVNTGSAIGMTKAGQLANQGLKRKKRSGIGSMFKTGVMKYDK
tara:strand:- start:60 stop:521 length:462 start_codon:yes stop_codon:yes gene_type:complete